MVYFYFERFLLELASVFCGMSAYLPNDTERERENFILTYTV